MAAIDLTTYEDSVDHVLDVFDGRRHTRHHRRARAAVLRAYRDLPTHHKWSYFERRGQFTTPLSQSEGTAVYDHTGGANERQVTISGATFPDVDDLHLYKLIIGQVQYKIDRKISSTVVTLTQDSNPGEDVASTSYILYKSLYPLPINFRRMIHDPVDLSRSYWIGYMPPADLLALQSGNYQPQEPLAYTIRSAEEFFGGLVLEIAPPPNVDRTWDYMYEAQPRALNTEKYSDGTISVSGTTVTGTGTAWTSDHVGTVLRSAQNSTVPTGRFGGPDDSDNPYTFQRIVMAVNSATDIEIDETPGVAVSDNAYSLSDPIDLEPHVMYSYFERLAELEYYRQMRFLGDREQRRGGISVGEVQRALVEAKIADNRQREMQSRRMLDRSTWGLQEWATAESLAQGKIVAPGRSG